MHTYDAAQAHQQPASEPAPRWSPADDLLVWTVSRIDGGRRHGVERDCHVVYALSRGFFVEQTRTFRASAEQCIEMLQQGKRAGTTQRKVALDNIVAIRSDARSGRLLIRTLNGTHQLDPVSYDEADVLRQIAIELELRMPPGGAEFLPLSDSRNPGTRRDDSSAERRALASLENSRTEDIPDNYQEPDYRYAVVDGSMEAHRFEEGTGVSEGDGDPGHFSEEQLDQLAQTLVVETDPVEPTTANEAGPDVPTDVTVVGGVEIAYEPTPNSDPLPATHSVAEVGPATSAGEPSPPPVVSSARDASWATAPEDSHDSPIYISQQGGEPESAEPSPTDSLPDGHQTGPGPSRDGTDAFSQRFGRLSHRALRHRIESGTPVNEPVTEPVTEPGNVEPSSVFSAPTEAVDESELVGPDEAPPSTMGLFTARPAEDRRQADDPNFPSVFDRRGAGPAARSNGPSRFGDDLPVDHSFSQPVPADTENANADDESDESQSDLATAPPTISTPTVPAEEGIGGTVGFNSDFDVNPFR